MTRKVSLWLVALVLALLVSPLAGTSSALASEIDVVPSTGGYFTRSGQAYISVDVYCTYEGVVTLSGTLTQVQRHSTVTGPAAETNVWCYAGETMNYGLSATPTSGKFTKGAATLSVQASASWGTGSATTTVNLVRAR
jgi:hypothetical protein